MNIFVYPSLKNLINKEKLTHNCWVSNPGTNVRFLFNISKLSWPPGSPSILQSLPGTSGPLPWTFQPRGTFCPFSLSTPSLFLFPLPPLSPKWLLWPCSLGLVKSLRDFPIKLSFIYSNLAWIGFFFTEGDLTYQSVCYHVQYSDISSHKF